MFHKKSALYVLSCIVG